jgi:dCMP deaminase
MRISRELMFMEMAMVASKRSTCFRRNVGALIVHGHVPISIGYNGPASGEPHCTGKDCAPPGKGCVRALHAEANAIDQLPVGAGDFEILSMYTTESPCPECAIKIMQSAIRRLYYTHLYRLTDGVDMVARHMPVYRITPAGHLINHKTGELVDA